MARRRSKSEADRGAEALGELLMITPWWVGPLLAVGLFLFLRYGLPPLIGLMGDPYEKVFPPIVRAVAPVVAIGVLLLWVYAELRKRSRRRLLDSRSDIESLRSLSWQEFEQLVGEAYRRQGYVVEETAAGADGGVDLVLHKGNEKTLVQCKRWKTWKVGVPIVRELLGVVTAEGASKGILVTCGRFTREARRFAEGKPLQLIDGPALWQLVSAVRTGSEASQAFPVHAAETSPSAPKPPTKTETPICPDCGSPMVLRTARKGPKAGSQFYGCSKYPKCHGTRELESQP